MPIIRHVPSAATRLIAVCGKCSRKLDGGFGADGDKPLAKALKRALDLPKPKHARLRLVETRCLKLCPKGAVVVADSAAPGSLAIVAKGTPIAEVIADFGLGVAGDRVAVATAAGPAPAAA